MAECLKCKLSFEVGKKFCRNCGSQLIESKDIFAEALLLFNQSNYSKCKNKLTIIPCFSFFYDKALLLLIKIHYRQKKLEVIYKMLINKEEWLRIDHEEKKYLSDLFLKLIHSYLEANEFEKSLILINKLHDLSICEDDKIQEIVSNIYFAHGKKLLAEKKYPEAHEKLNISFKLGNNKSRDLLVEVKSILAKNLFNDKQNREALKFIDGALAIAPELGSLNETRELIVQSIDAEKLKRSRKLKFVVSVLVLIGLLYLAYYLFFLGTVTFTINLTKSDLADKGSLKILLNGEFIDHSELKSVANNIFQFSRTLTTGEREIIVSHKYFQPETLKINVNNAKDQKYLVLLKPVDANISIKSNPSGSLIFFNNEQIGKTPYTLMSVSGGKYKLKIFNENYYTFSKMIDVEDTTTISISADLQSRLLFYDNFDQMKSGWENFHQSGYINFINAGAFQLINTNNTYYSIAYLEKEFSNFELISSITVLKSPVNNSFGGFQFCGKFPGMFSASYFVEFSKDGYIRLGKNQQGTKYLTSDYNNWQKISNWKSRYLKNLPVKIIVNEGRIQIYVDNSLILFVNDYTYDSGNFSLLCAPRSHIRFNFVKILQYDKDYYKYVKRIHRN